MAWTSQIVTPTFVIEGVSGNAAAFPALARSASRAVTFVLVPGADHFSVLQPGSRHVARAILADAYPGREIVTVDARPIFARGGGIHCITQQQPALPREVTS